MQGDPQGSAVNATASIGCARVFKQVSVSVFIFTSLPIRIQINLRLPLYFQINKLKIESFRRMTSSVDFKSDTKMRSYKERLASFDKTWPYDSDCNCSAEKVEIGKTVYILKSMIKNYLHFQMAEAGFYHIVSTEWPDLVRCFYCRQVDEILSK